MIVISVPFKGDGAGFFLEIQESMGYRGCSTVRQSKGLEKNTEERSVCCEAFSIPIEGLLWQALFLA